MVILNPYKPYLKHYKEMRNVAILLFVCVLPGQSEMPQATRE